MSPSSQSLRDRLMIDAFTSKLSTESQHCYMTVTFTSFSSDHVNQMLNFLRLNHILTNYLGYTNDIWYLSLLENGHQNPSIQTWHWPLFHSVVIMLTWCKRFFLFKSISHKVYKYLWYTEDTLHLFYWRMFLRIPASILDLDLYFMAQWSL